ncbi:MAG: type II toxin-antitoxin system RelE/ParE family toxin [Pseudomonadales bacterium]|jgi:toxin ParE1/3/4|nr:type II toxin-antitoxin system RelE/ParE family toxin [Pseudomonadales bacterium]
MNKWKVRLTLDAAKDFAGIIQWTKQNFGAQQALAYTVTLKDALTELHCGPDAFGVKRREDIGSGILTLHVARNGRKGRHFVVFRVGGKQVIDVLRLLHDSMDLASHLSS